MKKTAIGVLIMAAGKGTRMKSSLPKVLHPVLEKPMLAYLLEAVLECKPSGVAILVGHGGEEVADFAASYPTVDVLWQKEQLGTGHAVKVARSWWKQYDHLLVLNGDLPLLTSSTLEEFMGQHTRSFSECSLISFLAENPNGYGRVVRQAERISVIEHKDASPEQRLVREVNAGCYFFDVKALDSLIDRIGTDNAQGEYYLPDVLNLMSAEGMAVQALVADEQEMVGVNTQAELASVSVMMRKKLIENWMEKGVRVMDPSSVWIGPDVLLDADVTLMPGVQIWGRSVVGSNSVIGSYCILRDVLLGKRVNLIANVVIENSELCDDAKAGPFAYIREHSLLKEKAFVGKFVEVKKTVVGCGSKIPHLSYVGDAVLGEKVNVGAGSITCNYDGKNKFPTQIGDRVFIGSDTMMVAPVVLGNDSTTAAGSVITSDVPEGALGVGRARQKNIEGWAKRKKEMEKQGG